jgi:hypothetical protein
MTKAMRSEARLERSVLQMLDWAFAREKAQLCPPRQIEAEGYRPGISTIWVMMQRGNLGCQIDGGGQSDPHEDADVVAAVLANLPDARGGFRMAMQMAELARAGQVPDALVGVRARCVPVAWRNTSHGLRAETKVVEVVKHRHRGRVVERAVTWCPVTFTPSPDQIGRARRAWLDWYGALHEVRCSLQTCGLLRRHVVTDAMPPLEPWKGAA